MSKRIISLLFAMMLLGIFTFTSVVTIAYASELIPDTHEIPGERQKPRLVDDADILNSSDEEKLSVKLDEISKRQQFDVVVVTVNSLDGRSPMEYADDYYDYNGFGYGIDRDGAVLMLSMEERKGWISTCGYGINAITDAGREYMLEKFVSYLSDGDYYEGFDKFADLCDDYVTQARTGEAYDTGNLPKEPMSPLWAGAAAIGGALISTISCFTMKGQLKKVRYQTAADSYVVKDSLNVTNSNEIFLYQVVNKVAIQKDDDSRGGGGSVTHTSSSGSSHGGGGFSF